MKTLFTVMAMTLASFFGCQDKGDDSYVPKLTDAEKKAGVFTTDVMLKMKRLGEVRLSPDGTKALYSVTVYNVEKNVGYTNLWIKPMDGGEAVKITKGDFKDYNARWAERGEKIYFLSNRSGKTAIWSVSPDGENLKMVTEPADQINAFELSPVGGKILYTTQVKVDTTAQDLYPAYDKANVKIYDDLMARHWDYWLDGTFSHIKVADFSDKNGITSAKDIMEGEAWDSPLAPYFDIAEITWNNEGTQIAYTAKKLHGYDYAISTNSDIYLYDLASGKTRNITEGMPGYDRVPVFSPSDSRIAWCSMERAGNEADKERLFVMDLATGEKSYITKDFDYNAGSVQWADNNTLYFIAPIEATHQICRATVEPQGNVEVLTEGLHDFVSMSMQSGKIAAAKTTLLMADELFAVDARDGEETQLSFLNKNIYDSIKMARVEKRWIKTTDDKKMLTWVVLPPDFDSTKTYPTLLYCQGGPQSVVSQRWSYRWNLALMASQGYVVVAPNRRGLPSFGQEWLDQISGDYSGQNIKDYLSAIDAVSREKWVDKNRLGCVGASYGGYSVYYLAGHHDKRFKAFIAHCGMFNLESFYGSTEELWFPRNDLGGPYWSENKTAKRSYANSPHKSVAEWDTPILIMVGQLDYRIPYTESLQAFTAARSRGLDSRLVFFEDEGHQVFKPQNSLVWHSEFFNWLDKYVKNPVDVKPQPRPEDEVKDKKEDKKEDKKKDEDKDRKERRERDREE